jgi:hypothetical protein
MRALLLAGVLSTISAALVPSAASAQLYWKDPNFRAERVIGGEPGISLPMPGATAAENSAALVWNLRAAMNVAALSCHPWPFLNSIDNYNEMLTDHGDELGPAYETVEKYFTRTQGQKAGMKAFDDYNTKTYNGFSTLYGKLSFCQMAGTVGKEAAFAPRGGGLLVVAQNRMRELRNSLTPTADMFFAAPSIGQVAVNGVRYDPSCYKSNGQIKSSCR